MNVIVLLVAVAILVAIRFLPKKNILVWLAAWWVAAYVFLRWGIDPALPTSILNMFMAILTLALLAYMSADSERFKVARDKTIHFLTEKRYTLPLIILILLLPSLVALRVYFDVTRPPAPPASGRTIHPSPPPTITFRDTTINLTQDDNPYRMLEAQNPEIFGAHVENGRRIYYENCVFCHGDDLAGDGLFAHGFEPIPANFRDATTIAMLQEAYIFWRIAKGGPGLPAESTPWKSAMPAWEDFLTAEEIWDVTLFLYDYTGHRPRAREHVE